MTGSPTTKTECTTNHAATSALVAREPRTRAARGEGCWEDRIVGVFLADGGGVYKAAEATVQTPASPYGG